jgi:hypothetical protein
MTRLKFWTALRGRAELQQRFSLFEFAKLIISYIRIHRAFDITRIAIDSYPMALFNHLFVLVASQPRDF